jgi:type VI secretion system protein ImpF
MAGIAAIETLQPCLLDRLTDDEPDRKEESWKQRVVSPQKYRQGFLRDLEWLLNTQGYISHPGAERFQLKDYPEAFRSVVNYGTRQLSGLTEVNLERLQDQLAEAIAVFEPRILTHDLNIRADLERNLLTFEIRGDLWTNQKPEPLHLKTTVDLETGLWLMGDAPHG